MATTKQIVGWSIAAVAFIAVIVGLTPNGWLRKLWSNISSGRYAGTNGSRARTANGKMAEDEYTCEFVSTDGKVINISGRGAKFKELCEKAKSSPYSQMYLGDYGYPYNYYPYRYRYYWNYYPYYQWYYFPYYYTWNVSDNGNGNGEPAM